MTSVAYELKNAYIGWEVWTPDASRTMLYLKFENNLTDSSWNNQSVSWAWIWYWTIGNKYYVERTWSASWTYIEPPQTLMQSIGSWDFTVSFWLWWVNSSSWVWLFVNEYDSTSPWYWLYIRCYWNYEWDTTKNVINFWNCGRFGSEAPSDNVFFNSWPIDKYSWNYVTCVRRDWIIYWYVNWQEIWHETLTRSFANPWVSKFKILNRNDYTAQAWAEAWARMSEVILEKVWWSAEKCVWYFNSTKSNYWF